MILTVDQDFQRLVKAIDEAGIDRTKKVVMVYSAGTQYLFLPGNLNGYFTRGLVTTFTGKIADVFAYENVDKYGELVPNPSKKGEYLNRALPYEKIVRLCYRLEISDVSEVLDLYRDIVKKIDDTLGFFLNVLGSVNNDYTIELLQWAAKQGLNNLPGNLIHYRLRYAREFNLNPWGIKE